MTEPNAAALRKGWTTGACATAAVKAALQGFWGAAIPDAVSIELPRGERPAFSVVRAARGEGWAEAGIVKDAGDDPDVTHGVTVIARVEHAPPGAGVVFRAGEGVGTVTMQGLPIAPGEPAINPVPRKMIEAEVAATGQSPDIIVTISVPSGAEIAVRTWNPRLGIVGGISILGTTGVVRPYSCAAWIASIQRGIDVARAAGLTHVAAATGSVSEGTVQRYFDLPDYAMIDMGDFAGGMLKYLNRHPVERLTIAGGFGKLTKLAQGAFDLHSARSQVDFDDLGDRAKALGANPDPIRNANTAMEAVTLVPDLALPIAESAREAAATLVPEMTVDIMVISRDGRILAQSA